MGVSTEQSAHPCPWTGLQELTYTSQFRCRDEFETPRIKRTRFLTLTESLLFRTLKQAAAAEVDDDTSEPPMKGYRARFGLVLPAKPLVALR